MFQTCAESLFSILEVILKWRTEFKRWPNYYVWYNSDGEM